MEDHASLPMYASKPRVGGQRRCAEKRRHDGSGRKHVLAPAWKHHRRRNTMKARKGPLLALTSALMAATSASSASAWENPLENPYLDEPPEVCDQGSFFVGGVPKVTKKAASPTPRDPPQNTIGQASVQVHV